MLKRTILQLSLRHYEILGGIFLSIFLQAILSTIAFLATSKIVGLHLYRIFYQQF